MFRAKVKLLLGGALGLGWTFVNHFQFDGNASFYYPTDKSLGAISGDLILQMVLGLVAVQVVPKVSWTLYKEIWNHLFGLYFVDTYINDHDVHTDGNELPEVEDIPELNSQSEAKLAVEEKPLAESKNHLQDRLNQSKFEGTLPNGAMDVSTRDILNNPRALVPCGHSHSEDQIQHFGGKCPCCRKQFTKSVPNYNLRQLLPEVVDTIIANIEKKQESRPNPFAFYQLKDQITEPENSVIRNGLFLA